MGNFGQVIGFKMTYEGLNLDCFKNDEIRYKLGVNSIAINEFNRGFKIKRLGKATKKGTGISFEAIKTKEEAKKIREDLIAEQQRLLDLTLSK